MLPSPWDAILAMVAGWAVVTLPLYALGVRGDVMGVFALGGVILGGLTLTWWYGHRDARRRRR